MNLGRRACLRALAVILAGTTIFLGGCDRLGFKHGNEAQVDMARVQHPAGMRDADREDAVVVTVMRTGDVLLGQNKTSVDELSESVRDRLAGQPAKMIYIRADARAPFRAVEDVMDAAQTVGVSDAGLLTANLDTAPKRSYFACGKAPATASVGLGVSTPWAPRNSAEPTTRTIVVQILRQPGGIASYKINATDVTKAELPGRLTDIYANRNERVLFVKGDDGLDFRDVAEVIDIAKASGVDRIGVLTPRVVAGLSGPGPDVGPVNTQSEIVDNHLIAPVRIPRDIQLVLERGVPPPPVGAPGSSSGGANKAAKKAAPPERIEISSGVAAGLLLEKTQPVYPPIAKAARIQGTVVLELVISKTGEVESLRVISGHPLLVPSAVNAVKTWRYRPYLLNDQPVTVETTVNVVFSLFGSSPADAATPPP